MKGLATYICRQCEWRVRDRLLSHLVNDSVRGPNRFGAFARVEQPKARVGVQLQDKNPNARQHQHCQSELSIKSSAASASANRIKDSCCSRL
jgi:hypothetical protein